MYGGVVRVRAVEARAAQMLPQDVFSASHLFAEATGELSAA